MGTHESEISRRQPTTPTKLIVFQPNFLHAPCDSPRIFKSLKSGIVADRKKSILQISWKMAGRRSERHGVKFETRG